MSKNKQQENTEYDDDFAYACWLHYVMVKYDGQPTEDLEKRFKEMASRMRIIPVVVFFAFVIAGFIFAYNNEAFNDPTDPLVINMFICSMVAFLVGIIPAVTTSAILERPRKAAEYDELYTELERREYLRECHRRAVEQLRQRVNASRG